MYAQKPLWNALSTTKENFYAIVRGKGFRYQTAADGKIYLSEGCHRLQVSDKHRAFEIYRNGIEWRGQFLFESYCLGNIDFKKDDIVFDCGANSGDLFLELSKLIQPQGYYAFEPNPQDFEVLNFNVDAGAKLFNFGLGNANSDLSFFVFTRGGDSSFIEPRTYTQKITVPSVRLDWFIRKRNISSIKLLKIEAEGFEPEILEGLGNMLSICEYIALDGGYERGKNCEQTFTVCTNYLLSKHFQIVDICFPHYRALYKRIKSASF